MRRSEVFFAIVAVALFGFVLAVVLKRVAEAPSDPRKLRILTPGPTLP
jgi:hypothetical protein